MGRGAHDLSRLLESGLFFAYVKAFDASVGRSCSSFMEESKNMFITIICFSEKEEGTPTSLQIIDRASILTNGVLQLPFWLYDVLLTSVSYHLHYNAHHYFLFFEYGIYHRHDSIFLSLPPDSCFSLQVLS